MKYTWLEIEDMITWEVALDHKYFQYELLITSSGPG